MKIPIDFSQYPNILKRINSDMVKEDTLIMLRKQLKLLDNALANNHHKAAKDVFNLEYPDLLATLGDAFFDYEGITNQHHNKSEAKSMNVLGHDANPLSIFTNGTPAYDSKGHLVPSNEWWEPSDLKNFIQSLLYASRFMPLKDLAHALSLEQYDLIDTLKARNYQQLQPLQLALNYQKENDLITGKFKEGTGLLDCGPLDENEKECPICNNNLNYSKKCLNCYASFDTI